MTPVMPLRPSKKDIALGGLGVVHFSIKAEEKLRFRRSLIALMGAINVEYARDKICNLSVGISGIKSKFGKRREGRLQRTIYKSDFWGHGYVCVDSQIIVCMIRFRLKPHLSANSFWEICPSGKIVRDSKKIPQTHGNIKCA